MIWIVRSKSLEINITLENLNKFVDPRVIDRLLCQCHFLIGITLNKISKTALIHTLQKNVQYTKTAAIPPRIKPIIARYFFKTRFLSFAATSCSSANEASEVAYADFLTERVRSPINSESLTNSFSFLKARCANYLMFLKP